MTYPLLNKINRKSKQFLIQFAGLNAKNTRQDGEMRDMKNLTSTYMPFIAPRAPRNKVKDFTSATYVGAKGDKLFWVDGTNFVYDGVVKGQVTAGEKQIAIMNDFIIILPDKKHYDVVNDKFEVMEVSITTTTAIFTNVSATETAPGECSLVIGGGNFDKLKKGDGIKISGCGLEYNNRSAVIKEISASNQLKFDENTFKDWNGEAITIKREIPNLEFVIEAENRLWGCVKNEIFASKQGDHLNFNVFAGIATDSYATSVGSDGPFTAAMNYSNNILFFKEDCIHRIFGSKPSNYQVITTTTQGVQQGCHKSLAIANEVLFYKARKGICAYNGALPDLISDPLGYKRYGEAIAGSDGSKYYCCLKSESGYDFFVFDALQNVWHKEDALQVAQFINYKGIMYYTNAAKTEIWMMNAPGITSVVDWKATLGPFTEVVGEKKGYSKLQLRAKLEAGSTLEVWISYNGLDFQRAAFKRHTSDEMQYIAIQLQRCDYFDIELRGTGKCQVKSLIREFFVGSDI